MYKRFMVRGQERWMLDGKLVPATSVPEDEKQLLRGSETTGNEGKSQAERDIVELARLYEYQATTKVKDQTARSGKATPVLYVELWRDGTLQGRYASSLADFRIESFQSALNDLEDIELVRLRQRTAKLRTIQGPGNVEHDISKSEA